MNIKIDPMGEFKEVQVTRIVEAVGIIPVFAEAAYVAHADAPLAKDVFNTMMNEYGMGFGNGTEMDVTITPDGAWVSGYEEDEDLYPLIEMSWEGVKVYVYQHALVAVVGPDTTLVTRMD